MPDSQTTIMKQNVRFRTGICLEKIKPNQIQNGGPSSIIHTIIRNTGKSWKLTESLV